MEKRSSPMNWFYVENNQQQGPVSESQLEELSRAGRIEGSTLIWRQGMPEWQPMQTALGRVSSLAPVAAAVPGGNPAMAACVECHRMLPTSEMVNLNQNWICPHCKPVYLQRLAEGVAPAAVGILWRSKNQVVARSEAPFPDRCFKCNAPAHGFKVKRKLSWHHPAIYLILFVALLLYVIVAFCVRKTATVSIPLCEQHRKQRIWFITAAWLCILGGLAVLILSAGNSSGALAVTGLLVIITGVVLGVTKATLASAGKINGDLVWVRGAGKPFLNELPEWTGPNS